MQVTGIDHLYAETTSWDASLTYWGELGFQVAEAWGSDGHRAARLTAGNATIILAEPSDAATAI